MFEAGCCEGSTSAAATVFNMLDLFLRSGIFGEMADCLPVAASFVVVAGFYFTGGNFFLFIEMLSLAVMLFWKGKLL